MMWSTLEAYSNEALFCNYGEPQDYRQAMFGHSSVECYSFRSFFPLRCPYENYLPWFYYCNLLQCLWFLVETKFSDSKCMCIQCVRSQTLVLASSHWKWMMSGHFDSANQCPCVTQHNNKTHMMFNRQFWAAGFRTNHILHRMGLRSSTLLK